MPTHTVKQGEHLTGIAEKYGLTIDTIWNHADNAALKNKRKYPHVLFPGDQLFIPDKKKKEEQCATTKVHRFRIKIPRLKLRIALTDFHHQPIPNADCELKVGSAVFKLKSDGSGVVEANIPTTVQDGKLQVKTLGIDCPVKIGHLDPVDEEPGWKGRLINLDYYDSLDGENTDELRSAIEEFQCDHKLKVTGVIDAATQAKLKERHGV